MTPSKEVDAAVGEDRKSVAELLNEKRVALAAARERYATAKALRDEVAMGDEVRLLDALKDIIRELETSDARIREASAKQAATGRLVGIRRAYGSVQASMEADETRVNEKIAEVSDAIARLNDRYTQSAQLRAEALALADRFNLPKPTLPDIVPPMRRGFVAALVTLSNKPVDHANRYQPTEECAHQLRTRRTYAEAAGTPGGEIIEAAGLKPFPELTERQSTIIAAREREKEQERRQLAGLPTLAAEWSVSLGTL
jgi:hypothetical protein